MDDSPFVDDHGLDDSETLLDDKYFGLYRGQVVNNLDPDNLQRVKFTVEALIEESDWAWPSGLPGSGGKNRGVFMVPPKGAEVLVGFEEGDVDSPYYFTYHCGEDEIHGNFGYNSDGEWNQGVETDLWLVEYDDQTGKSKVRFTHKESGAHITLDVTPTGPQAVFESTKTHLKSPLTELSDTTTDQIIKGTSFVNSFATFLGTISTAYSTWSAAGAPTPASNGAFIGAVGGATVAILKDVANWLSAKVRTG
jgi:hypothetical protein